jgi:hypothetical protein
MSSIVTIVDTDSAAFSIRQVDVHVKQRARALTL